MRRSELWIGTAFLVGHLVISNAALAGGTTTNFRTGKVTSAAATEKKTEQPTHHVAIPEEAATPSAEAIAEAKAATEATTASEATPSSEAEATVTEEATAKTTATAEAPPYIVECKDGASNGHDCKVSKSTFKGWRTFHAVCHVCHAQDAVGSTFAPSLVHKLENNSYSKEHFIEVITNGYKGQIGVMPAWKDNPNVMPKIDDLWAYLKARADGVLPPGRPGRLK